MKKNDLLLIGLFVAALAMVNAVLILGHWTPWIGRWDWELFGTMTAAAVTIALFSQLYKDNPVFKLAEHLFVGTMVGYTLMFVWFQVWVGTIIPAFSSGTWSPNAGPLTRIAEWFRTAAVEKWFGIWSIIIPCVLGMMIYGRLSRKLNWVSRVPFALLIGFGVGLAIPTTISANLLKQLQPMMVDPFHDAAGAFAIQWNQIVVLLGVMSTLVYFFFSVEHTGAVRVVSRTGVWFLMIAFGASFGLTVMARLSLLIARVSFLFTEWIPLIR